MVLAFGRMLASRSVVTPWKAFHQATTYSGWKAAAASGANATLPLRNFCSKPSKDGAVDEKLRHSDDPALERLFVKNREWVDATNKEDPGFFKKLGAGQSPEYLYIGCSDSRVSVASLVGLEMGDLFVHRNVANMVVSTDLNLLSVITYAVEHLKVKHILLTGHYDCGGVRAAMTHKDVGPVLDGWIQNIRDVYRLHQEELDAIADEELRHRRLVELNVAEQCLNLYKCSAVQKNRHLTHLDPNVPFAYPRVHGLVFDPATGVLCKVPINYRRTVQELRSMYELFDEQDFKVPKDYYIKRSSAPKKK